MLPYQEHAASLADYEAFLGGGNVLGAATLSLALAPSPIVVPVTHTKIDGNFQLSFGHSSYMITVLLRPRVTRR